MIYSTTCITFLVLMCYEFLYIKNNSINVVYNSVSMNAQDANLANHCSTYLNASLKPLKIIPNFYDVTWLTFESLCLPTSSAFN